MSDPSRSAATSFSEDPTLKYSQYPRLGDSVSRVGYGAFGLAGVFGPVDRHEVIETLHYCWDQGVNFLDTARHYQKSEGIIGEALRSWNGARPFIATKVEPLGPPLKWARPVPVETCFPPGHVLREAEISLRTLGVDRLDLLQLHLYWPTWGVSGYWLDELESLKESGLVRSIGISLPDQRHDLALPLVLSGRIDSVQTVLNIFDPTALDCLVPLCVSHRVAVIARCVLDEGGLSGTLREDSVFSPTDFRARYFDSGPRAQYLARVEALRSFLPTHAGTLARLALKFVLHDPGITAAVSSMHLQPHAVDNIAATREPPLDPEVFQELLHHHRWVRNFYAAKVL